VTKIYCWRLALRSWCWDFSFLSRLNRGALVCWGRLDCYYCCRAMKGTVLYAASDCQLLGYNGGNVYQTGGSLSRKHMQRRTGRGADTYSKELKRIPKKLLAHRKRRKGSCLPTWTLYLSLTSETRLEQTTSTHAKETTERFRSPSLRYQRECRVDQIPRRNFVPRCASQSRHSQLSRHST
jgi:hypothetical protein